LFGLRLISQRTCLYKIMKPFWKRNRNPNPILAPILKVYTYKTTRIFIAGGRTAGGGGSWRLLRSGRWWRRPQRHVLPAPARLRRARVRARGPFTRRGHCLNILMEIGKNVSLNPSLKRT